MEAIRRNFFNGTQDDERKITWVKWTKLTQILDLLGTVILSNMEDRWIWDLNGDGEFCVKDVRNLLDVTFLPKAESFFAVD
ncbi:hypothetical protein Tco_0953728 [Tanacetum coccineum]|uniref:RNA-directed DNA polymerase, eukaryota, reverse transcriptase zinc-binding domain protein n=1 Tax=Tanacetum coccineum TaxID=301880 RepID=A0ABQ5E370_9ASTR